MRASESSNNNLNSANLNSRQNTIKKVFFDLVHHSVKNPEKNIDALSEFFNNLYHKKCLKSQITPQKAGAFGALWDGALSIVNTIDLSSDNDSKNDDFDLLKANLTRLTDLF